MNTGLSKVMVREGEGESLYIAVCSKIHTRIQRRMVGVVVINAILFHLKLLYTVVCV